MEVAPEVAVTAEFNGSSSGIKSLIGGGVDIANASRNPPIHRQSEFDCSAFGICSYDFTDFNQCQRIGDHAVNIAEWGIYTVTGERS